MKIWVPKGKSSTKTENEPLKNICAAEEDKWDFFAKTFQKLLFSSIELDSSRFEELFLDYASRGNTAFAAIVSNSRNRLPEQFVKSSISEKGLAGFQKDFSPTPIEIFVLNSLPRPPDASGAASFARLETRPLDKISRRIRPRSPPVLL